MGNKVQLSTFNNAWYDPGASFATRLLWYITNTIFFQSRALLPYAWKSSLLRLFGAEVGRGLVVKPGVNIKYPWKLKIGDFAWIGENVWIDCLDKVSIGANACISQGAFILSGNHDYTKPSFDLILKPIHIEEGAWIGAKSIVVQGAVIESHAVLMAGSIASGRLEAYGIYQGAPAKKVKERIIE